MKLYGAMDLHSNNNVTVLIDEQDKVVYEKRLPNDLGLIAQQLAAYQSSLEGIVVESTYNWYWLVDGLMTRGTRFIWPTPQRSNSTKDSSTPMTSPMRAGSPTFYGWEFYPKVTSIPRKNERSAICCASAANWCVREPPTY